MKLCGSRLAHLNPDLCAACRVLGSQVRKAGTLLFVLGLVTFLIGGVAIALTAPVSITTASPRAIFAPGGGGPAPGGDNPPTLFSRNGAGTKSM